MQKIIVNRLGPVSYCELTIDKFMVFTGPQASGKSTIAKSVFFFKNIKNLLFLQLRRKYLFLEDENSGDVMKMSLEKRLIREIRSNFLQIFGTTWCMDDEMYLSYQYNEDTYVKVSLKKNADFHSYLWIELSDSLKKFLFTLDRSQIMDSGFMTNQSQEEIKRLIGRFFSDTTDIVYIPAGRSLITLLSTQLNYLYSSMDDVQKRTLDYCTQNYLERILQMKAFFSEGPEDIVRRIITTTDIKLDRNLIKSAVDLMQNILRGEYRNVDGEERLLVSDQRYVKINFASSGQQESVWILNVLFYYLVNNKKTYFIIEEPESHLFPNAQKLIMEFVALMRYHDQNQVFITTHSPYILGTINNLLYAHRISGKVNRNDLEKIIDEKKWLDYSEVSAYYIENGKAGFCMDEQMKEINNEVIDGASEDINRDFDRMVLLKEKGLREDR